MEELKNKELKNGEEIINVVICKNPRCITSTESYVPQVFYVINKDLRECRCKYCDDIIKLR